MTVTTDEDRTTRRLPSLGQVQVGFWIRRLILVALALLIVTATWKTLTLPDGESYSAKAWKSFLIGGVSEGSILALIALGYSLVYGILRMINFAHGEVFMMGAFGAFFFADSFAESGSLNANPLMAILVVLFAAIVVSVGIALLLERVCYRPLRSAPRLVPLITAIGASLFLQNSARGFFGSQVRGFPRPDWIDGSWNVLSFQIDRVDAASAVVAVVLVVLLDLFVARTRTGRSMRAVAEDADIARLMGIDVDRVVMTTFVIGGALAGVAAVMYSLTFEQISFSSGFRPGIAAFTAAVLGGIGSIRGAALGALLVGLLRSLGPALLTGFGIPSVFQLEDAITFLVLVFVLLYRPGGLLGSAAADKL